MGKGARGEQMKLRAKKNKHDADAARLRRRRVRARSRARGTMNTGTRRVRFTRRARGRWRGRAGCSIVGTHSPCVCFPDARSRLAQPTTHALHEESGHAWKGGRGGRGGDVRRANGESDFETRSRFAKLSLALFYTPSGGPLSPHPTHSNCLLASGSRAITAACIAAASPPSVAAIAAYARRLYPHASPTPHPK